MFVHWNVEVLGRNPWIWNLLSSQKLLGNKDLDFPDVWDKLANKKKEIILSKMIQTSWKETILLF